MASQEPAEKKQLFSCYNKGCGKQFDLEDNGPEACQHHPGNPVFHDALKGWSCCNKKSTDFTQFLNIPGCTKSPHSNVKQVVEVKKEEIKDDGLIKKNDMIIYEAPKVLEPTPRPLIDQPLVELRRVISPNLTAALEKLNETLNSMSLENQSSKSIPLGTPCKNAPCQTEYQGEDTNNTKCIYHPGIAIFHEGMKYWSCCQRKTSDFNNFLSQTGCTEGSHVWFKEQGEKVDCRYDFHQAAGNLAILTIYSKNPIPEKTSIKANQTKLDISVVFESGSKRFVKSLDLFGVIKIEESKCELYPSKVEIKLKKADPISWSKLEFVPK